MGPKKKKDFEEEWEEKMVEMENRWKRQLKKIENKIQENEETYKEEIENLKKQNKKMENQLQEDEEKHKEDMRKLEKKWEEKYDTKIEVMENRYITTFRNLGENQQINTDNQKGEVYRGTTADITKPLFYGNRRDTHPIDFLNRLDEYFTVKQIMNMDEKLIIAGDCLRATASNWFATIRFQINSYKDFQNTFKEEYWSRDIQMQLWSQCLSTRQVQHETNYREHFAYWATKLRHLEVPRLAETEIVSSIASHYPGYLRAILISLPECTILNAMKILGTEEHRRPETREDSNHGNRQNQSRENSNNQFRQREEQPRNWNNRPAPRNHQTREDQTDRNGQIQRRDPGRDNEQQWRDRRPINQVNAEEVNDEGTDGDNHTNHVINNVNMSNVSASPYLKCTIEDEQVQALIDTGATISVINKGLADQLLKKNQNIPVLPINSVQISNAVGKKICKVSKQLFCVCQLGDKQIFINFIQVENLNERAIIGADVLNKYNAHIDFNNKTIQWSIQGQQQITPFSEETATIKSKEDRITNIEINDKPVTSIVMSQQENETFNNLLDEYQELFSDNPGLIWKYECQIKVKPGDPIAQRPYPIPITKLSKMDKEIQRMLDLGVIEKSNSPWSSPIIGIEKKNGEIRLCLDARQINKRIIPDRECPMGVEEILHKFQGAKYLSTIDLTAGYWQCPLKKESREITAFLHRGRNYQFKVLPFGLINSVAEFQKILDKVLGPEVLEFTATYVDDIHITSTSFDEHIRHLRIIFEKFTENNIKINIHKSQFLREQITFLGHIISEKGISMDPEKIKTIQEFQAPRNQKQVRAFLGFINFYRKYIRDLSQLTEKLSQLTKKNCIWKWESEQQSAFEQIKKCFLEDIIIGYPDFKQPFFLVTDASGTHIGAELYQMNAEGKHRTIGFTSRTLNEAERKYYTTERELLAIVFGCKKYRNYILGHVTNLLTDHQALTFLNSCRLLNARLMRWSLQIQEFDLHIQHIAGKENIGADTLTRYPQISTDQVSVNQQIFINQINVKQYSQNLTRQLKQLHLLQKQDPKICRIIQRLKQDVKLPYQIHNNLLFYKDSMGKCRVMIPDSIAGTLIQEVHENYGHSGATKIYKLLKMDCQLKHMFRTIKRITQSCDICQKSKIYNQQTRGPLLSIIPEEPGEMVSLDLIGPLPTGQLGAKYILVMMDVFSKYIQIYPLKKATAAAIIARIEKKYIPLCGPFKKIITDNGTQFHSKQWINRLQQLRIKVSRTTTYHPEGNPVERANKEIGRMLRTYCYQKHTSWVQYLPKIEFWINNTTHFTTGCTPQELMGKPRNPIILEKLIQFPRAAEETNTKVLIQMVQRRMKRSAQQRNHNQDKGKKFPNYEVGQYVLVKEKKLSSAEDKEIKKLFLLYRGPYVIMEVRNNNTVVVEEEGSLVTYNIKNVKPYVLPVSRIKAT